MRVRARFLLVATSALAATAPITAQKPPLDDLLTKAGWYLDYFVEQFENVVAEESYTQDANSMLPSYTPLPGRGGGTFSSPSPPELSRARHRDLVSDFLLVKSPDTSALVAFRDVIAVDGVAVRDRQQRLAKLFLEASPDSRTQALRIGDEGARYNLGNMRSTLGNPVLGLGVLQFSYQRRFTFSLGREDRTIAPGVWIVEYQETSSPAMIRGEANRDLFAHGRVWIDAVSGAVLKTELQVEQPAVRAVVVTAFRRDDRFDIAVPREMREQYTLGTGNKVSTVASYGRFRRFDVTAAEEIHAPARTIADPLSGMTFVELQPGRFTMGSATSEAGRNPDEVLHDVTITRPFLIAQYEATQQQWRAVMDASPSTFTGCGPRCPVESVTFFEVQEFIDRLNAKAAARRPVPSDRQLRYRLPTEAEWEYACRAGTTGPFSTGETLSTARANFNGKYPYGADSPGEYRQKPSPVGSFPLNPWGLGDMHGNVWEWTSDWYGPYTEPPADNLDPKGPSSGDAHVIRGGSWYFDANSARCGLRYTHAPKDRGFSLGFRLAADEAR